MVYHCRSADSTRTKILFPACNELIDCVHSSKGDLSVVNVVRQKLKSKHEQLYSSFHLAVTVAAKLYVDKNHRNDKQWVLYWTSTEFVELQDWHVQE